MATPRKKRKPKHRTHGPILSAAEVRFCTLLIAQRKRNATQAYIDAGLHHKDRRAAGEQSYQLLKKPEIRALIRQMEDHATVAAQVTVDRIAASLADEAFGDRTAIYDRNGKIKPPHKWPKELRALLVGMESTEFVGLDGEVKSITYKPKFVRPTEAKRMLAQWRRMIGQDAQAGAGTATPPLVVGGDANPGAL